MIDFTSEEFEKLNKRYKDISNKNIATEMLPSCETIEGLRKKVEASEKAGKGLLPEYYEWEKAYKEGMRF